VSASNVTPSEMRTRTLPAAPAPRFHHLAVGPTALGELILGATVNATYTFRSALVSHAGPWTTTDGVAGHGTVARWARAYTAPLSAVVTAPAATGTSPASRSFASVDEPNVVMPVIKRAEDGDGYVVRLLETVGTRTAAHARLPFAGPSVTVSVSTTVERDVCLIGARPADGFEVAIEPHELLTLRVRTGAAPAPAGVPACPGKGRP